MLDRVGQQGLDRLGLIAGARLLAMRLGLL